MFHGKQKQKQTHIYIYVKTHYSSRYLQNEQTTSHIMCCYFYTQMTSGWIAESDCILMMIGGKGMQK